LPADKMSACATFGAVLFFPAVVVPQHEGDRNGLEDTEDRRSAGRHGNQHVCLRGAQVTETSQPPARRNAVLRSLRRAGVVGSARPCRALSNGRKTKPQRSLSADFGMIDEVFQQIQSFL
jgi:hypothetical protein